MGLPQSGGSTSARGASYALYLLLLVYVVNHIDRQVMYILVEPVKNDLGLSDAQMGILTGVGFALFYTVAGIPIARWADRGVRRNIIAIALAIWSAMTVASGLARGFGTMLAARIGVGIGEAGCTPPAHSILSDHFPPEKRARVLSIYQLGSPLGILFGFSAGGFLAESLGWRVAFFAVGAPGLLLALIVRMTLAEPVRGQSDRGITTEVEPLGAVLRFMWSLPALRHMMMATSLQTLFLAAGGAWHTSFFIRVHGLSLSEAGLVLALSGGIVGGVMTFAGGWLSDRFGARNKAWYFWWPAIGAAASIPFSIMAYLAGSAALSIVGLTLAIVGNHMYSAVGHAVGQSLVRPRMRGMMSAVALFLMNIVGFGLGPYLTGVLSDAFGIQYALLALLVCLPWACVHYVLGARTYARDLEAKNT